MGKRDTIFAVTAAALLLVLTTGCKPEEQDRFVADGREAVEGASSALKSACGSLAEEAQKLNSRSSADALEAARRKAGELQAKLSEIKAPTELESLRLDALKEQVQRLDAAIMAQSIRQRWEAALRQANQGKELVAKDVDKARLTLREADTSFKALDDRLLEAERAYKNACNRLSEALAKEDRAGGKPKAM
jgi:hypothetical protein